MGLAEYSISHTLAEPRPLRRPPPDATIDRTREERSPRWVMYSRPFGDTYRFAAQVPRSHKFVGDSFEVCYDQGTRQVDLPCEFADLLGYSRELTAMDKKRFITLLVGDFSYWRLLKTIGFLYVCLVVFALVASDQLIFQPQPSSYQDSPEIIKLKSAKGRSISALHLVNPRADYTVLYSHGKRRGSW